LANELIARDRDLAQRVYHFLEVYYDQPLAWALYAALFPDEANDDDLTDAELSADHRKAEAAAAEAAEAEASA